MAGNPTPKPPCTFPGCGQRQIACGLCASHYQQRKRGLPLRELRGPRGLLGAEPLARVSLRVSPAAAACVADDRGAARETLEAWARMCARVEPTLSAEQRRERDARKAQRVREERRRG